MYKSIRFWIFFAIGTALAVALSAYSPSLTPPNGDGILYLQSSISQGLAAIFALVFTITIFGAQMMRKFTSIDKMLDNWTILLMIIFSIGIILPLMQLRTDKDLLNINGISTANLSLAIDLGLATFCILTIIPYLIRVNRIMKYDGGVSQLREEASEAIDKDYKLTAEYRIKELIALGKSSVEDMIGSETLNISSYISDLGLIAADREWADVTTTILIELEDIGLKGVKKKSRLAYKGASEALEKVGIKVTEKEMLFKYKLELEYPITNYALKGLTKLIVDAIECDIECDIGVDTVFISSKGIFNIGIKVVSWRKTDLMLKNSKPTVGKFDFSHPDIVGSLILIANSAYRKDSNKFRNISEETLIYLWVLGAFIMERWSASLAKDMTIQIKESCNEAIGGLFESVYEDAKKYVEDDYPDLKYTLDSFKELFMRQ